MRNIIFVFIICFSCVKPLPPESVDISLPPSSSTLEERIASYDENRIVNKRTKSVYIDNEQGADVAYSYIESVKLKNGIVVSDPKSLADEFPGTELEEHYKKAFVVAEEAKKPRRSARRILVASILTFPLIIPSFIGFVIASSLNKKAINIEKKALREFDLVYLSYNEELRSQLKLCIDPTVVTVDGEALVECPSQPILTP